MSVSNYKAKLVKKEKVSSKVYHCTFELLEPGEVDYLPGQFFSLLVDKNIRRSYSIASVDNKKHLIDTFVDVVPGGVGSQFFSSAYIGQEVSFLAPLGHFLYYENESPVVFLATGTGITPYLSMFGGILRNNTGRKVHFFWGLRHKEDIFAVDLLEKFKTDLDNFNYYLCLSRAEEDWSGERGYCTQILANKWKTMGDLSNADFYLCGRGDMINDGVDFLDEKSINGNIYFEKY